MPAALLIVRGNAKHAAVEQLIDITLIADVTREVHVFARAHAPRVLPAERLVGMRFLFYFFLSLRVLPRGFQQQASISLLHRKSQLPEGGVVGRPAALQAGDQLLVLCVVFKEVPDGEDGPLADNWRCLGGLRTVVFLSLDLTGKI